MHNKKQSKTTISIWYRIHFFFSLREQCLQRCCSFSPPIRSICCCMIFMVSWDKHSTNAWIAIVADLYVFFLVGWLLSSSISMALAPSKIHDMSYNCRPHVLWFPSNSKNQYQASSRYIAYISQYSKSRQPCRLFIASSNSYFLLLTYHKWHQNNKYGNSIDIMP